MEKILQEPHKNKEKIVVRPAKETHGYFRRVVTKKINFHTRNCSIKHVIQYYITNSPDLPNIFSQAY